MAQEYIKCPKDPEAQYLREACEEIFIKGNIRHWCRECSVVNNPKKTGKVAV